MGLVAADKAMERSSLSLVRHTPVDLLQDASAASFAAWLAAHPSVELISRDRGTTFADGATRGAPHAQQIADRWHVLHNLGEALEKVLARHHADLKRVLAPQEEHQVIAALDENVLAHVLARSQTEQLTRATLGDLYPRARGICAGLEWRDNALGCLGSTKRPL